MAGTAADDLNHGGSPTHPGWYHNLRANPVAEVEVGTETITACAEELEAAAHHPLWSELVAASPSLREYLTPSPAARTRKFRVWHALQRATSRLI